MSVRDPLGALTVFPQTAAALYSLYRAVFDLDGQAAARALSIAVVLIIGMIATIAYRIKIRHARTERERTLEDRTADLQRQVHRLAAQLQDVQRDVDCKIITEEWRQIFHRVATRNGQPALRVVTQEEA